MRKWFTKRRTSNEAKEFQSPSVIMCHHSIGVVAYVGRSVLLKVKIVKCTKRTPRIVLDSDKYPKCVETTPRVFGPVTWLMLLCRIDGGLQTYSILSRGPGLQNMRTVEYLNLTWSILPPWSPSTGPLTAVLSLPHAHRNAGALPAYVPLLEKGVIVTVR
jgi:hypothetical protein